MQAFWEQEYEVNLKLWPLLAERRAAPAAGTELGGRMLATSSAGSLCPASFPCQLLLAARPGAAHDLSTLGKGRKGDSAGWEDIQGEHRGRGKSAGQRVGARTQQTRW